MIGIVISWTSIVLAGFLAVRGFWLKLARTYPFFYWYIVAKFASDVTLLITYSYFRSWYRPMYWNAEFLTIALACGIVLEIYRHVLSAYPGPERFARIGGISAFLAVVVISGASARLTGDAPINQMMEDLEKNLRSLQAVFLAAILLIIAYYGIRIGRNMKGMIAGYGVSIACSLLSIAANLYTRGQFAHTLGFARQFGYTLPLGIWAATMWSYHPNPVDIQPTRMEQDYARTVARMHDALGAVRGYFEKGVGF
jgi:hypothetical protein